MTIGILDYGLGNPVSVSNMLKKIGYKATIVNTPDAIEYIDKLILPGVGHFQNGMKNLENAGLIDAIQSFATNGKFILGICLGMQLLTNSSEEGQVNGLGLIPLETKKFTLSSDAKIPHMGWSTVHVQRPEHPLFQNIDIESSRYYFVHSYYVNNSGENVLGTTSYEKTFASIIGKDNILGMQFHPEKSHKFGMALLKSFCKL